MKKNVLLTICMLFSLAVCAAQAQTPQPKPAEIKKPPEWTSFLETTKEVKGSEALTADAKTAIAAKAAEVKARFEAVWTPFEQAVKEIRELNKDVDDAQAAIDEHNANAPAVPADLTNRTAVEKYNKDIVPYNDEAERLNNVKNAALKKAEAETPAIRARGEQQIQKIEEWLHAEYFREFMKVTTGLLTGRIKFTKGLAWRQLVEASKGYRDPMFDGAATNNGPDAVDASSGTATKPQPTRASPNSP